MNAPPSWRNAAAHPVVFRLGLASLFTDIASDSVVPLLPLLLAGMGAGPAFIAIMEGAAEATAGLFKLIGGRLADRLQRLRAQSLFGYALANLVRPLMAVATSPLQIASMRLIDRVGKGLRTAPRDTWLSASVEEKHAGRAFGLHRSMDHLGATIGPLLASALLALGASIPTVIGLSLIPGIISLVVIATAPDAPPAPMGEHPPLPLAPPREILPLLALLLPVALGTVSEALMVVRLAELHAPLAAFGVVWALMHLARSIGAARGGAAVDRSGPGLVMALGLLGSAVALIALAATSSLMIGLTAMLLLGLSQGLVEPAERTRVARMVPAERRGSAFGWYNLVRGGLALPAGVLLGGLWQAYGSAQALGVAAGLTLLSALLVVMSFRAPPAGQVTAHPAG